MALHRSTVNLFKRLVIRSAVLMNRNDTREIKRWVAPTMLEIQRRRDRVGVVVKPRSSFLEWNYDAELYAFGQRLGEQFEVDALKKALTFKSYIHQRETQLQTEGSFLKLSTDENSELIERGNEIIIKCIQEKFEKNKFVKVLQDYLMGQELLAQIGSHIGLKDIVLTAEFPVNSETLANAFKAIIGVLEVSSGLDRANLFVEEILFAQLNGKEIYDLWEPQEPYNYLLNVLKDKEIEPRLCNQSATETILANYQVGLYSEKKLIGIGWGETVDVAKNTAALNAIEKIYNLRLNC